ncbi:GNAT family N-acetyltransferase [Bowmanella yangjiangensis]|uniref:GNAT family N-acetyltransferase n=1 Tax=Bowmanella yangjiangensis TaxID=2811230 RepID=A0ABS3CVC9_9ALTE|nr:GNAT family N-acetyltransferase [Bowmanella yangjiangensis]MBN7820560.1 GNAT family N-acetyltransferase [Bowmanella yangjiangensis]
MLPTLGGHRLYLRHIIPSDVDALLGVYADPKTMRFAADPVFTDTTMMQKMLQSVACLYASGESFEWAIVLKESGLLIGTCGLHSFNTARNQCEVGCLLGSAYWGKGLMQEALSTLIPYAREIGIQRLLADIDQQNLQARRFFIKQGFQLQGDNGFWLALV